jgi:competence protein ComEA
MRPSIAKLAGICFAASLLVLGATALTSRSTTSPASPMPAAATSARPVPMPQGTTWPDGPGKQQFLQICGTCHGPENVLGQTMDTAGWTDVINQMISNGAQGSDADFSAILTYLVTNFGPTPAHVAINKATAGNLQAWLNLPADQAQAIVDYRTKNGDFKSLDDVKKVPGVDPKLLDAVAGKLTYDPSGSSASGSGSSSSSGAGAGGTGTTNSTPPAQQPPSQ